MKRSATIFSVIWLLLSLVFLIITSQLNFISSTPNPKLAQFVLLNSFFLIGVGVFFFMFHDRLKLYLENYRREKEI